MVNLLRSRAEINDLLLPCGGDQVSIDPALPKILQIASARSPMKTGTLSVRWSATSIFYARGVNSLNAGKES